MTLRISRLTTAAALALTLGCSSLTDVDSPDVVQPEQLSNAAGNSLASCSYGRRTSHQDQQRRQTDPMDYVSF